MKRATIIIICLLFSIGIQAQSVVGAWEGSGTSESGVDLRFVVIFSEGYQVLSIYEKESGKFVHCNGGTWKLEGTTMTEKVEFHTDNREKVGTEVSFEVILTDSTLSIVGNERTLKRIDNGSPGRLNGAWLMSGRIKDGETQQRDTNKPRKTMKLLSGSRFQWIAYNTETKEFKGTGGGTYTTIDGKYTENIEFFSKDDNKVGMSLEFNYELKSGDWHHSGFSSKGDPIYEIWSLRE